MSSQIDFASRFGGYYIEQPSSNDQNIKNPHDQNNDFASQFGGYYLDQPPAPSSDNQFQGEDSVGRFAARSAKSAVSGAIGGTIDTATSLWNLPVAAFNLLKEKLKDEDPRVLASMGLGDFIGLEDRESPNVPLIPSATHAIDKGIDKAVDMVSPGYTTIPENEKPLQAGIRDVAAVASPVGIGGIAGKVGLSGVQKASNFVGSTNPITLAGAATIGAVSEDARQKGDSEATALGKGALAGLSTELILSKNPIRGLVKVAGAGKKSLNTEVIEAANKIGVDLPLAAVSKAQAPNSIHQILSRIPGAGDYIASHSDRAAIQFTNSFEKLLDKIGPKIENKDEFSHLASEIYKDFRENLPEEAFVSVTPLMEKINSVKQKLKSLGADSEATKAVLTTANDIEKGIKKGNLNIIPDYLENAPDHIKNQLNNQQLKEVNIRELLRQNIELNKKMRDKNLFNRSDTDSLDNMRVLKEGIENTFEQIAEKNPNLYDLYNKAKLEFSRLAKREELENLIRDKLNPPSSPDVPNYNALSNILSNKNKKEFLRNNFGEHYDELDDFVKVARAIESIKKNNKNPSGSGWISLITAAASGHYLPKTTLATLTSVAGFTLLSTSKRFINLANRYAKNPTQDLSKKLETIIKDVTGTSARDLGMQVYDVLNNQKKS